MDKILLGQIIQELLPLMGDVNARRSLIETAVYGSSVLNDISWNGSASTFTTHIVQLFDAFGTIATGQLALVALLEEVKKHVGLDHHGLISDLIKQLEVIKAQELISESRRPKGKLINVPKLPRYSLSRPEDLDIVCELLLRNEPSTMTAITAATSHNQVAVQGMGGIGKTVLAAMACYDLRVRQAFPDGIYWLSFGTQPQIATLQSQLVNWIDGKPTTLSDVESLRLLLAGILSEKKCLLVLDDVWQGRDLEGFQGLGEGVHLLVTTRKQTIITALDAVSHQLAMLNEAQAYILLSNASAVEQHQLPSASKAILKECNGLPLAIAMIGSALKGKDGTRWQDMADALAAAELEQIETYSTEYTEYNNLWKVIHVSVAELDATIQKRYLEFAVFPDDVHIPEQALKKFWQAKGLK
jgi:hypothetical protein